MTEGENMLEICARAIYDATDPLSGDNLATLIIASDHLFPQREHLEGNPTSKAYQLAAMDVCRTAVRAVIEALMDPPREVVMAGIRIPEVEAVDWVGALFGTGIGSYEQIMVSSFQAMLRTASKPNEEGEGK
jgi:hypothetical protein